jgi:formylglycine-generating enzyme required for sulfatase activity
MSRIPRYARLIARLEDLGQIDEDDSEATVLWKVHRFAADDPADETGLLDDGFKADEARDFGWHKKGRLNRKERAVRKWQVRLACDLLGAIAFEMYCSDGEAGGPAFAITGDVDGFVNSAFDRFESAGAYLNSRGKQIDGEHLWEDWRRLKAMDSHGLKYFLFSESTERVQFTDITTQAFFAAYWAGRWASDDDRVRMQAWVPDPLFEKNEAYAEFWRLLAEMPREGIDLIRWQALFAPLYDVVHPNAPRDEQGRVIRATEFIYLTWDRMEDTEARDHFCREFTYEDDGGFISLGRGQHEEAVNVKFTMGAPDGEAPDWDGSGKSQDNPAHPVELSAYYLHRFCVTNVKYERFDVRHFDRREFTDKVSNTDNHPVVNVSWFDAWCYAKWLGLIKLGGVECEIELPTEARWEYACRCGRDTPFTWDAGSDGTKIDLAYCNYNGEYLWPDDRERLHAFLTEVWRSGHTLDVCGVREDGERIPANVWGFHQMHGNVWEWCHDWYGADYYRTLPRLNPAGPIRASFRVLRGGSWINYGEYCRSAYRSGNLPGSRRRYRGFRLAAVPAEPV